MFDPEDSPEVDDEELELEEEETVDGGVNKVKMSDKHQ